MVRVTLILFLIITSGCNVLGPISTPIVSPPTPAYTSTPPGATSTPEEAIPPGPVTLRIWLPPQFDPSSGNQAGRLLQKRLDEFASRHSGVRLDVRIKDQDGNGGMLDSLSSTSVAAPKALPDLALLPRPILETAALKGLLHPLDGLTTVMDESSWYDFARQLASIQGSLFGLPFAGDALLLVYRPSIAGDPPRSFSETLELQGPLAFTAADQQSLFTLSLYQAAGGPVQDAQGRPALDETILSQVLAFYQQAATTGLTPAWLAQYERDEQSWASYLDKQANLVVTWVSRYLSEADNLSLDNAAAPLITPQGDPYTLATGWVWALASPQPEKQELAIELAEFLTKDDFLADWTAAAGYLPVRNSTLPAWQDEGIRTLVGQVAWSAHLYPSTDVLSSLAPILRFVTTQALMGPGDPLALAREAVNRLANP